MAKKRKKVETETEQPTPAEVAQDAAVGETLAPTQFMEVDAGPLSEADRRLIARLESAYVEDARKVADLLERHEQTRAAAAMEEGMAVGETLALPEGYPERFYDSRSVVSLDGLSVLRASAEDARASLSLRYGGDTQARGPAELAARLAAGARAPLAPPEPLLVIGGQPVRAGSVMEVNGERKTVAVVAATDSAGRTTSEVEGTVVSNRIACTTCGGLVLPGATCPTDGQVAPC